MKAYILLLTISLTITTTTRSESLWAQELQPVHNHHKVLLSTLVKQFGIYDQISNEDLLAELADPDEKASICSQLGEAVGAARAYVHFARHNPNLFTSERLALILNLDEYTDLAKDLCATREHDLGGLRRALGTLRGIFSQE